MEEKYYRAAYSGSDTGCDYKSGSLPKCAPLGAAYVPKQKNVLPQYGSEEALTRGTLFPGLDLPFMNIANKSNPYAGTPAGELMALDFVIRELNLYLDTHQEDTEAFKMLKSTIALYNEGKEKYIKLYGPITIFDTADLDQYTWLHDPWPWEPSERTVK